MTSRSGRLRLASESARNPVVPNGVLGMTLFIASETMLFGGMVSAFTIVRSSAVLWPPLGQPRLPFAETAVNTAALLLSGVFLYLAQRAYTRDPSRALRPLGISLLLGGCFVLFQGAEWVALVGEGLTITSSTLGSFFYLIVGMHGLHALAALGLLVHTWLRLRQGWRVQSQLAAAQVFWYFVVGLWPILYLVVYL
jgi:heme/copper-type cytochrome/quinol oxidase subunit 3